ncbi:class I SAM-dependent methyltransferase [Solidesulfovibrio magneticus]|uniref:Methyltransferase domain-containing protein n=1 Tax=Solidesulfovibrio magneticus (strain ATCC 700980 / DSM 13731 / RS-1) TaxID=573370 RepID=C4XRV0_SOLM1|nr:class I SAM-dependent methyltransferase [Solidesulfovibrio magneticus]BAH78016.1 hypothetical protein DMR_45250 [Solidesulfovibrio magneticus RS-1]
MTNAAKTPKKPLQSRFPRLWLTAQYLLAGFFYRGRAIVKHLDGRRRVLEVGCSVGIDSVHFSKRPCDYLGVDIDADAIALAAGRYRDKGHMRFLLKDVRTLSPADHAFDFILFCGSLHHMPDADAVSILNHTAGLLAPDGIMVVIDYALHDNPGWMERFILALEEGRHVREQEPFLALLTQIPDMEIAEQEIFRNPAFLLPWPIMAHKFCLKLRKRQPAGGQPAP